MSRNFHRALIVFAVLLTGCEYGDRHGSAANNDVRLGLKVASTEVYSFRKGAQHFTGYFISEFPQSTATFFDSPPTEFFNHPQPLSYEENQTFVKWRKTPVSKDHTFLKARALNVLNSQDNPAPIVSTFTNLINATGCFYAVHYEDLGGGRFDNFSFYMVEPNSRRLHKITNTSSF